MPDKVPVMPGTTAYDALGMLSDEVVWHMNSGRRQCADHILYCCEKLGILLPPSCLRMMSGINLFLSYRERMFAKVDFAELRMKEDAAKVDVLWNAMSLAIEQFNPDPANPGWSAEMYEDQLRDAVCEYADAIRARRAYA